MYNRRFTPEMITALAENEIFVFGSNLEGAHGGGAARIARKCFGAVWGQGVGLQGQSYAIPTMQGDVATIRPYVDEFIAFATRNPELQFLVTKIGCGIAGFRDEEIAPLFDAALDVENIILPLSFVKIIVAARSERIVKDKIRGSLMAGAAGDALGYEVEFISRRAILARYGERGITRFALHHGRALISDDTQMTLFTANGLINSCYLHVEPQNAVTQAYIEWYHTQGGKTNGINSCWIGEIKALHSLRAPGNTCMSALGAISRGAEPCNNSKGCGGVMRVAPVGLFAASQLVACGQSWRDGDVFTLGAECAKITHKHPLGWLPAGLLAHIIYEIVERSLYKEIDRMEFEHIVGTAVHYLIVFSDSEDRFQLQTMIFRALELARQDISDAEAIRELGEGWTGDEALAIAIYCASRHFASVEDAIIASVNHDGDSDSTGSICGNIMGAIYGYEHIKNRNLFCPEGCNLEATLELSEITLALADDLATGCVISEYDPIDTPEKRQWYERYSCARPAGIGGR